MNEELKKELKKYYEEAYKGILSDDLIEESVKWHSQFIDRATIIERKRCIEIVRDYSSAMLAEDELEHREAAEDILSVIEKNETKNP